MRRHTVTVCTLFLACFGYGCASVNPKSDYAQTSKHVATAIGADVPGVILPSADAAKEVESLLAGGLTADEAVQIALLNNPRVRSGFASIGAAKADVVQSGLFNNPSLSFVARFPDGGGLANINLDLAQNIAGLWLIPVRKRVAEAELNRLVLSVARDVSSLAFATRTTYFQATSAERERQIASENRDVARQLVEIAEARQQAGVGNTIDINLARAGQLNTELELRAATLAAAQAKRDLASLLGLVSAIDAPLSEPLPDPPAWSLAESRLVALAQASRLDLLSADRAVRAAEAKVEQEKRSVFSNVEVGIAMERDERRAAGNQNFAAEAARQSINAGALTIPEWSREPDEGEDVITGPSLSLDLPIFDQNRAQIAKAQYALEQANSNRDALAIEIAQESRSAYDRARTAWGVASLYRNDLLPLLENNLELSREAYRSGKVSFLSVLESQRQLLQSRARYIQALRDSTTTIIDLEKAAGRPLHVILENDTPSPQDGGVPSPNSADEGK